MGDWGVPAINKSCDLSLVICLDVQLQDKDDVSAYVRGMSRVSEKESLSCGPLPSSYLQSIGEDETWTQKSIKRGCKTTCNQR